MSAPEPMTVPADWRALSACHGQDPELFFPAAQTATIFVQLSRAKAICARCPVSEQCLRYALATGQEYGVWGGTSEEERKVLRRRLRVGSALARPAQLAAAARRRGRACAG